MVSGTASRKCRREASSTQLPVGLLGLAMKTKRDYLVRIKQVVEMGMLREQGLDAEQEKAVVDYITTNQNKLRELSGKLTIRQKEIQTNFQ